MPGLASERWPYEPQPGPVGEGRLRADRPEHAGEGRGVREAARHHHRAGRPGSRLRRRETTAVPAARLGANVLGVDIARNLVEAGNARAESHGLANCRFQEGDATDLHELEDDQFDLVLSMFGAMFAPRPFDVAQEIVRVTRPGGRIVMGNWIATDPTFVAQLLRISASYSPPPPAGPLSAAP